MICAIACSFQASMSKHAGATEPEDCSPSGYDRNLVNAPERVPDAHSPPHDFAALPSGGGRGGKCTLSCCLSLSLFT